MNRSLTSLRNVSLGAYILLFGSMIGYVIFGYSFQNGEYTRNIDLSTLFILMTFIGSMLVAVKDQMIQNIQLKTKILITDLFVIFALLIFIFIYPTSFIVIKGLVVMISSIVYISLYVKVLHNGEMLKSVEKKKDAISTGIDFLNFRKLSGIAYVLLFGDIIGYATNTMTIQSWVPSWDTGMQYIWVLAAFVGLVLVVLKDQMINTRLKSVIMFADIFVPLMLFIAVNTLTIMIMRELISLVVSSIYIVVFVALLYKGKLIEIQNKQ